MTAVVVAPAHVALAASQARVRLLDEQLRGEGFTQAIQLGERVVMMEPLERAHLLNMRSVLSRAAETPEMVAVQALLGGETAREWLFSADLPERPLLSLSQRLTALDTKLAERILGQLEAVFTAAVGRTAIKVAKKVKKAKFVDGCPIEWLDSLNVSVVKSAISGVEETAVLATVDDLAALLPPILRAASGELAEILADELGIARPPRILLPDLSVDASVELARRALASLILGRLSRNDVEVATSVPPNIARDILHAAGGADTSNVGGVPKSDMGRVLVAGVETQGDGFATSQRVVDEISEERAPGQEVQAQRYWDHRSSSNPNEVHRRNEGKRDVDCDFSAGPPGAVRNCNCVWTTRLEVVS